MRTEAKKIGENSETEHFDFTRKENQKTQTIGHTFLRNKTASQNKAT